MKTLKYSVWVLMLVAATLVSCTDKMDWDIDPTLDRCFSATYISISPRDTEADITFDANMMKANGAEKFEIQVTSATLADDEAWDNSDEVLTFETEDSPYTLTGLIGATEYSLRMRALSSQKTASHWVHYASSTKTTFKTKSEQIMNAVANADRDEDFIIVSWDASKAVTKLTVSDGTEEEGQEPRTIELDDEAKAAGRYKVTGLNPSTTYTFAIYYNDTKRGEVSASTNAKVPTANFKYYLDKTATVIDQNMIDELAEQAKAASSDPNNYSVTIGINADQVVEFHGTGDDGNPSNIKLPSGMSITFFGLPGGEKPTIKFTKNLDITGSHAFVTFQNVKLKDDGAGYVINQKDQCFVEEFSVIDCEVSDFATTFVRYQGNAAKIINKLNLNNSIFTQIASGYSFIHMDTKGVAGSAINNINIDGCTFDNVVESGKCFIFHSKVNMGGSINIKNSTFYKCVGNSQYFIDFGSTSFGCSSINIENCLFTKQPDTDTGKHIRASVTPNTVNSYRTSDFLKKIAGIQNLDKTAEDIFTDPANHNFTMKIDDRIGDPRWYKAE